MEEQNSSGNAMLDSILGSKTKGKDENWEIRFNKMKSERDSLKSLLPQFMETMNSLTSKIGSLEQKVISQSQPTEDPDADLLSQLSETETTLYQKNKGVEGKLSKLEQAILQIGTAVQSLAQGTQQDQWLNRKTADLGLPSSKIKEAMAEYLANNPIKAELYKAGNLTEDDLFALSGIANTVNSDGVYGNTMAGQKPNSTARKSAFNEINEALQRPDLEIDEKNKLANEGINEWAKDLLTS